MSKINLLINLQAYNDLNPSNSPNRSLFNWTRQLNSFPVENPTGESISLAPGQSISMFSGMRVLTQDSTTEYSIAPVANSTTLYTLMWSGGTAPNFRIPRVTGADATSGINVTVNGPLATFSSAPNTFASYCNIIAGTSTSVTITAVNAGTIGNSVNLSFNGSTSINTAITNWNTANPSNTIALTLGDGTQIPSNLAIATLAGGISYTPLNLISGGVVVGDQVIISSNFNSLNQGQWNIVSLNATSFTVALPTATAEGPIVLGSGFASQVQIFSSGTVQVGDTLAVSSGFSSVSFGDYEITQVASNYITFSSANALPTQGPIMTEVVIYSDAKRMIYIEADQAVQLTINGVLTDSIEPFISSCGCFRQPGLFLRTSTIYSLSISNPGIVPARVFLAACE